MYKYLITIFKITIFPVRILANGNELLKMVISTSISWPLIILKLIASLGQPEGQIVTTNAAFLQLFLCWENHLMATSGSGAERDIVSDSY